MSATNPTQPTDVTALARECAEKIVNRDLLPEGIYQTVEEMEDAYAENEEILEQVDRAQSIIAAAMREVVEQEARQAQS